jgi:Uncharacterized conserved protein
MFAIIVSVDVKPENIDEFIAITKYNHENSRKEPENLRFDFCQSNEDPTKFTLYEVYESEASLDFHKTQPYYEKWRDTVAPFMATPRKSVKATTLAYD